MAPMPVQVLFMTSVFAAAAVAIWVMVGGDVVDAVRRARSNRKHTRFADIITAADEVSQRALSGQAPAAGIPGLPRQTYFVERLPVGEYGSLREVRVKAPASGANIVSSELAGHPGLHAPALDLDVPAYLLPSSTPGHTHLYIDVPMTWRQYRRLLKALAAAGIIEPGYLRASLGRGGSHLRKPGVRKSPGERALSAR